jgi:hypothetical protein
MRSADEPPPISGIRGRDRDNTCDEIENNGRSQHVHSTNGGGRYQLPKAMSIFLCNQSNRRFRIGIFALTSSRHVTTRSTAESMAGFRVSNYTLTDATILLPRTRLRQGYGVAEAEFPINVLT